MKSTERHKLKENEFARRASRTRRDAMQSRQGDITKIALALLVLLVAVGGVQLVAQRTREPARTQRWPQRWRSTRCRWCRSPPPAPGSPPPVPQPGTFQTEQEKLDASLPKFLEAANAYPNSDGGHRGALPCGGDPGGAGQARRGRAALQGSRRQGGNHDLRAHRAPGDGRIADRAGQVRQRDRRLFRVEPRHDFDAAARQRAHASRPRLRARGEEGGSHRARSSASSTSSRSRRMPPTRVARWKRRKKPS